MLVIWEVTQRLFDVHEIGAIVAVDEWQVVFQAFLRERTILEWKLAPSGLRILRLDLSDSIFFFAGQRYYLIVIIATVRLRLALFVGNGTLVVYHYIGYGLFPSFAQLF